LRVETVYARPPGPAGDLVAADAISPSDADDLVAQGIFYQVTVVERIVERLGIG
jgi:hypothetical protein